MYGISSPKTGKSCKRDRGHGYSSSAACCAVLVGGVKLCSGVDMGPGATRLEKSLKVGFSKGAGLQLLPLESPTVGLDLSQPKPL